MRLQRQGYGVTELRKILVLNEAKQWHRLSNRLPKTQKSRVRVPALSLGHHAPTTTQRAFCALTAAHPMPGETSKESFFEGIKRFCLEDLDCLSATTQRAFRALIAAQPIPSQMPKDAFV